MYLLDWWHIYYYYEHDYKILPRSKDGGLNYALIKSMMAIDQYYNEGQEYQKSVGRGGNVDIVADGDDT